MRVVNQMVSDRCGHGSAVEYLSPVCKRQIGHGNRLFDLMPVAGHLEKQIRSLLTQRKITDLIPDLQIRGFIVVELYKQRMVCLRSDQMIEHIHYRGKKRFDTGIDRCIGDTLSQKAFSNPWIADQDDIHLLPQKRQGNYTSKCKTRIKKIKWIFKKI